MKALESFESYIDAYTNLYKKEGQIFDHPIEEKKILVKKEVYSLLKSASLPRRGDKDWNYINLSDLLGESWIPRILAQPLEENNNLLDKINSFKINGAINIVIINGLFMEKFSDPLIEGVQFKLGIDGQQKPDHQDHYFFFEALNQIFSDSQIQFTFEKNKKIAQPIHFLFLNGGREKLMVNPSVSVHLEEGAEAQVVETIESLDSDENFVNTLTQIRVSPGGYLKYCRIQNQNLHSFDMSQVKINVEENSRIDSLIVSKGAKLSRQNLKCHILGPQALVNANGIYYVDGDQIVDHHTWIRHSSGGSVSRQLYKGVLDGRSKGVFNGHIRIDKSCQGADSSQLNKNLLLSSNAEIDTKPEMDIYADDVKATHGAAIGKMNEEELFYLLSRGISFEKSKKMLKKGFASEVIFEHGDPCIQQYILKTLEKKDESI